MDETEAANTKTEMRDLADKGLEKAKGLLGSFFEKARKGTASLQDTTETATLPAGKAFARGLEFAEQHVTAAFDHAQKLVRASDAQEALKMQVDYFKTQSAALKEQTEELTNLAKPGETKDV